MDGPKPNFWLQQNDFEYSKKLSMLKKFEYAQNKF